MGSCCREPLTRLNVWLRRSYVLVKREEVVRVIAGFHSLEPRIILAISQSNGGLSFPLHDVHIVAVSIHRQASFQCINPLARGSLALGRGPAGTHGARHGGAQLAATSKTRPALRRGIAVSATGTRLTAPCRCTKKHSTATGAPENACA